MKKDRLARGDAPEGPWPVVLVGQSRTDPAYVRQLERELAEVRMERDVLKRYVAREVFQALPH